MILYFDMKLVSQIANKFGIEGGFYLINDVLVKRYIKGFYILCLNNILFEVFEGLIL